MWDGMNGMRKDTGRGEGFLRALPWLLLAAAYAASVGFFACYGMHNLDADMSSEMIYADLLNREGRLLTDSWYYSSELRTVSPVPLYQLGLLLFDSWHAARVFGTALMLAGILASFLFFARRAKMGEAGVYMAAVLAMPFSEVYAYVGFLNGGYSVYLMLVFVLLGLVLGLADTTRRLPALALIALLSFWGGTGGVRMMLFLAVPLAAAYALEAFDAMRRHERLKDAMPARLRWPLTGAMVAAAMTALGYLLNDRLLSGLYDYVQYDQTGLAMPQSDLFFAQLTGIAEFFGYRETSQMLSVRGLSSLLALLMMGISALTLIEMLLRRREGKLPAHQRVLLLFTLFSVALGVVINALTENYFARYYLPGLLMLIVMMLLCWQGTQCRMRALRRLVPLALCGVFALESAIFLRQEQRTSPAPYEEAANWLLDNGYTQGFATFWNAAPLTEASDGAITVYTMPDSYWQDDFKRLELNRFLQEKANIAAVENREVQGPVFVLLTAEELAQGVPYAQDAYLACRLSAGNIYRYEDLAALLALLQDPEGGPKE